MTFTTIGSIANFIQTSFNNVPTGLSGANLIAVVDSNRQHVANFVGQTIGSNSIEPEYEPPIVNLSKADTIDFINSQDGEGDLKLDDLSIGDSKSSVNSDFWRKLADSQLNSLGRRSRFARSIS